MTVYPSLDTDRLRLRAFEMTDVPEVSRLAGDRAIAATTQNIPHPYETDMAEKWIARHQPAFESGEATSFAIIARESDALLGAIGIHVRQEHRCGEIGYWIGKPYWGRGYATEAGHAVLLYGFEQLDLNRILARYFSENLQSGRVMEKLGMKYEGLLRQHVRKWGAFVDVVIWGILRSEYDELSGSGER